MAQNFQIRRDRVVCLASVLDSCRGMFPGLSAMANRFASIGVTVVGIILAAVPLALWVAWTPFGFLVVLAVGAVSVVLLGVLVPRLPPLIDDPKTRHDRETRAVITDEFVAEIHRISPLTYHHARIEKARFRRTMDRLRELLR